MKLKPKSPAGKRRARRRFSDLMWRRYVERDIKRLAVPCKRCGRYEYFACVPSCFERGKLDELIPDDRPFPLDVARAVREQYA